MKRLAFFSLPLALLWAANAWAHALSCTNPYKYTYFTEDTKVASKCRNNFDGDCNWKSTALNCTWQGSYRIPPQSKNGEPTPINSPKANPAPESRDQIETPRANNATRGPGPQTTTNLPFGGGAVPEVETVSQTETEAENSIPTEIETPPPAKNKRGWEEAAKEANRSAEKVRELKITMEEIKVSNQNNAILYRSPDANIGSVDPRFNAMNAVVSGDAGRLAPAGGLLGNRLRNSQEAKNLKAGKSAKKSKDRGLASSGSPEADFARNGGAEGASAGGEKSSATSDNPWISYMEKTSKAGLIDRLRKNPSLRDSLRDRIADLQAKGDSSGMVELMEQALAAAEKESQEPNLDDLKPMAMMEAFSMDAGETDAQIRSLLADLDSASDPQFLPQASLFERVSVAHRRSLLRGSLNSNH